jgi:hypothetical protein
MIKLLRKEINDITTEKMSNSTTTVSMYETGDEVDWNTKWSTIAPKRRCNVSKARNFHTDLITQNIQSANRYSILTNLSENLIIVMMKKGSLKV